MSNDLPEINYNKPIWKLFPENELRARAGRCVDCNERVVLEDFKDAISLREYTISGLCARCQDQMAYYIAKRNKETGNEELRKLE